MPIKETDWGSPPPLPEAADDRSMETVEIRHPAPWKHDRDTLQVTDANGATVVNELYPGTQGPEDADGVPTEDTSKAVVRLLLAAPELLNLCRGFAWVHPARHEEMAMRARELVARIDGGA